MYSASVPPTMQRLFCASVADFRSIIVTDVICTPVEALAVCRKQSVSPSKGSAGPPLRRSLGSSSPAVSCWMTASRSAAVAAAGNTSSGRRGACVLTRYRVSPMRRLSTKLPSMLRCVPALALAGSLTSTRCTDTVLRIQIQGSVGRPTMLQPVLQVWSPGRLSQALPTVAKALPSVLACMPRTLAPVATGSTRVRRFRS